MDSPLLVVLLLCLASPGRTEDASLHPETSGEHPEHIPMIPLQPSTRIELHSTSEAPRTNPSPTDPTAPPGIGPTADLPEDLYPQMTPTTPLTSTTTTSETSVPSHTPAPSRDPHSEEAQGGGSSEEEEVGGECSGAALSPDTTRALGGAMMKFGMEVLETLESKSKKPNILLSPLSVVLGLSQLSLGAVNETEAMLRSRLQVSELPCHHHLFKRLRQHLSQSTLQVASRVYLKKGFKVKEGFMKDSLQFYGSKPALLEGVDEVNHWVEEATNGRIKDFLSSLPEDVVLMLLNAVHFKAGRMKTTALALFMGALLSLASTQQADPEEPTPAEEEEVEIFTTPATQMAAAASNFGFNLYRQLAYQDPKANVFLSPLSIAGALTQLSLGGSPRTEQQLYRVLQYHHLMDPHLHSTLKDLLASVNTPSKGLSMASRVYINRKLRLKEDYLNVVEKEYGVRPKALTGSPRADLKEVNDWVRQQTGGKIAHFLSTSLPRNMGVLPLGAAHFRGQWVSRLQKGRPEPFQVDSWTSIQVPMMSETKYPVKLGIESDLNCKITQVPMQGDVSMLLILPNEVSQNLTLIEESLTAEFIHDVVSVLQPVDIDLSLPALSLSSENNLLPQLLDMGLAQLASQPELVKISTLPGKVNTVHHKVSLEVMEEGGQAARSSPSGSGLSLALSFHVNRPFIFLVRDDTSGAILFIGRVMDPRKLKRN